VSMLGWGINFSHWGWYKSCDGVSCAATNLC
jgi:hypothetical protein